MSEPPSRNPANTGKSVSRIRYTMEGLSAAGSALAVAGAARDLGRISYRSFKRLRDAPKELQDLLDEASRLQHFFRFVHDVCIDRIRDLPRGSEEMVQQGKAKMLELEELIYYKLTQPDDGTKVDRAAWMKHKGCVQELVRSIRNIQQDIVGMYSAQSL